MQEIIPFVIKNLKRRKLRSWLTIIGIVIGVFAIVSLLSLSQGLKQSINNEFSNLGVNKISITSKYSGYGAKTNQGFTTDDIKELNKISDIDYIVSNIDSTSFAYFKSKKGYVSIKGYSIDNFKDFLNQDGLEILEGEYLNNSKSKEIVLGYLYKTTDNVFDRKLKINDKLEINNQTFTIIGFLDDTGNDSKNQKVYLSIENLREITNTNEKIVDKIYVIAKDNKDLEDLKEKIEDRLERFRKKDDFQVTTPLQQNKDREEILDIVSIVVVGIAAISLLVGGIGITNSMYTSVLERRKEIGVLKAVGAKRKDILSVFLLESGIIGLIGGFIGLVLGFLVSFLIKFIASYFNTEILVSFGLNIILISLIFSFLVGIISGFLPAYQASNQEPVEVLREE